MTVRRASPASVKWIRCHRTRVRSKPSARRFWGYPFVIVPPGTKLPLPTARQCTVAPELEGGLAPAPKGGLNGAGGPIGIYTVYIYDDSVNRILLERRGTLWVLLELGNATQEGIALLRGK